MAIDLSYRASGVGLLSFENNEVMVRGQVIENPPFQTGFAGIRESAKAAQLTAERIKEIIVDFMPHELIIEMPFAAQSSKAALSIGMMWGITANMGAILVEPSLLKRWSESKPGDKKTKVKEKVLERVYLQPHQASNDNIVDAIGIALIFHEYVTQQKYDTTN